MCFISILIKFNILRSPSNHFMSSSFEKSIWHLFVEGDMNAFSTLFKTYYSSLHNYGLKISGDHKLTEDCLQSFFVYLHENRKKLGNIVNIKSYFFVSFRRSLLKALKRARNFSSYDKLIENSNAFVFSNEDILVEQEFINIRAKVLAKLLNTLSTRERETVYLKYYSELSTKEIAEVMNVKYQSVQNTLQKAFYKLRNHAELQEIKRILQIN